MKVENVHITGFKAALRGMRNPYDSWDRSDSVEVDNRVIRKSWTTFEDFINTDDFKPIVTEGYPCLEITVDDNILIGEKDLKLCKQLISGGSVHSKFLRYIDVTMDITAPMDFWKEYDTYKVATVSNSCSTMHTITKKDLYQTNFSLAGLRPKDIEHLQRDIDYINEVIHDDSLSDLGKTRIISKLLPQGFEQRRTVKINYATLEGLFKWRVNHKLLEWRWLCSEVLANFPYFKEFFIREVKEKNNSLDDERR